MKRWPFGILIPLLLPPFLTPLSSCNPSCEDVCVRLVEDCELYLSPDMNLDLCVTQCEDLEDWIDEEEDQEKEDLLIGEMKCIMEKGCEEISSGICSEENFTFE